MFRFGVSLSSFLSSFFFFFFFLSFFFFFFLLGQQVPDAWGYWTFWQYNDNGQIPGISGNVDVDYFAGDESNLHNLCF